jgi:hypothetical protein
MTGHDERPTCPAEILDWLPWYADALPDAQRGAVEAHAAECAACRAEIAMLADGVIPPVEAPDSEQVFAKVLARIEAAGVGGGRADAAVGTGSVDVGGHRTASPARQAPRRPSAQPARRRLLERIALAAAFVAVAAAGWLANDFRRDTGAVYSTASEPAGTAPAAPSDAQLDVVFRGDASIERINTHLRALGATVVSGPSQAGRYRIALPPGSDAAAAAAMMRAEDAGVASFVEPVARP